MLIGLNSWAELTPYSDQQNKQDENDVEEEVMGILI